MQFNNLYIIIEYDILDTEKAKISPKYAILLYMPIYIAKKRRDKTSYKLTNITENIDISDNNNVLIRHQDVVYLAEMYKLPSALDESHTTTAEFVRLLNDNDKATLYKLQQKTNDVIHYARERAQAHNLPMHINDAMVTFDNTKIIFWFISDVRVDFRLLLKDIVTANRGYRIELWQTPNRDEAACIQTLGDCGRELCCTRFACHSQNPNLDMVKTQNLSSQQSKLFGICGKIKCCIGYENETYMTIRSHMPEIGTIVDTPNGKGRIIDYNLLAEVVKVQFFEGDVEIANIPLSSIK